MMASGAPAFADAMPLAFVRSALFGMDAGGSVLQHEQIPVARDAIGGSIVYTGPRLGQMHALVWQAVVGMAHEQDVSANAPFTVSSSALLKAIGIASCNDTRARRRLANQIRDLALSFVQVTTHRHHFAGPLIHVAQRDPSSGHLVIQLSAGLAKLLSNEVVFNTTARKASLGRCQLTMWLHDYINSHKSPPPMAVVTLHSICGSTQPIRNFCCKLKAALRALAALGQPVVTTWLIDGKDRLIVTKPASRVLLLPIGTARASHWNATHHRGGVSDAILRARLQRSRVAL